MSAPRSSATETDPQRGARIASAVTSGNRLPAIDPDAYEILGEVARGGMGRISRARDRRLGRVVAIKQLLQPTAHMVALFEREVRITARLQHPSIVSLLEAGMLPSGELMYVMKLVPGRALRDVLRDELAVTERLRLLPIAIAIADALAYAHERGVIHRDLKPSNVLIGEYGEVVVIDWGLAHDAELQGDDFAGQTGDAIGEAVTAGAMGTPAYMAPEAARGEPVDERADVYAIGAILYETLSGAAPYRGADGATILNAVRSGPPEPIAKRVRGTPSDLAAIVDKAMARDREDRYPSARQLADELRRFATGQLVSAHEYSIRERTWRWLRRNRAPVAVAGAAAALVISLVAIGVTRIVHERDITADRADRLTLANARNELDRDPARALATLSELPAESPLWSAARMVAADAIARGVPRHLRLDVAVDAIAIVDGHPRVASRRGDAIELADGGSVIARIPARASHVALSADGGLVVAVGEGRVRAWRIAGAPRLVFDQPGPMVASAVAASATGSAIAVAGRDFGVASWRLADAAERTRDAQARVVDRLAVDGDGVVVLASPGHVGVLRPDGPVTASRTTALVGLVIANGVAVAATGDGELRLLEIAGGTERMIGGIAVTALAIAPDASRIATASDTGVVILDRSGHALRTLATRHRARALATDSRGVIAIADGEDVWWWEGGEPDRAHLAGATAATVGLAASHDQIVAAAEDGSLWAWRGGTGRRLGGHPAAVRAIAISADGTYAITTGDDRTVRRWPLAGGAMAIIGIHQGPGLALAISPDGLTVASAGNDRIIRTWQAASASAILGRHPHRIRELAFSPDGQRLAAISEDATVFVWSLAGGAPRQLEHAAIASTLAWLDDLTLVTGARDGAVTRWSLEDGSHELLCRHAGAVRSIAAANRRIASAGDDGRVGIGDPDGMVLRGGHDDIVRRVAFSADATALASASEDGTVRVWDPITGESRAIAIGAWIGDVAFAPDGAMLIAAGADGGVWLIGDPLPRDRDLLRAAIAARIEAAR